MIGKRNGKHNDNRVKTFDRNTITVLYIQAHKTRVAAFFYTTLIGAPALLLFSNRDTTTLQPVYSDMFNFNVLLHFVFYTLFITVIAAIPFIILCRVYKTSEFDMDEGRPFLKTSEITSRIFRNGIDSFMAVFVIVPVFVAIQTYALYLSKDATLLEMVILGSVAAACIHSIDLIYRVCNTCFMKPAFFSFYLWYLMFAEIKRRAVVASSSSS